ncbi:MAG: Ribonuclease P protein component [Parcubacteria group bacterium GW2011_GWD2_38_11]|nr:MAG: Ribonuclease P protein component [Parcubacteria group bacterium GW2011_GWD2_38_11]
MLPFKHRLKKREDFAQVFSKGAYAGFDGLSIKFAKNSLPVSRIGFPVGKNYSKKAVVRNRTRRILRKACSEYLDKLKPGFDIIVLIKSDYQNIELSKVISELQNVFSKANLLI